MADTNYPSASNEQNRPVRNNNNNTTKNIVIGVLAAGLLGTLGYLFWDKSKTEEKITVTQTQATTALTARDSVQILYDASLARLDSLTGNNNELQGQLSSRQSEIQRLQREIKTILNNKNATEADLRRARSLIGQLNSRIAKLELEVDRLTSENQ